MRYAWLTIKHKWFVFLAGLKTKAPLWRLVIHDWSKFTPWELPGYNRQFFKKQKNPTQWHRTWLHHQNHNLHHWEYWVDRSHRPSVSREMPEWAVREMIADWMGAGRAYEGKWPDTNWKWLNENFQRMSLHHETQSLVFKVLRELGYNSP
jgi:hypothetical protein